VRNYTPAKIDSLLLTIKAICPIGNDHWETVAQLHSNHYAVCARTAESLKRKFSSLASTQPSSGNPSMPRPVLLAKEIHEAINRRAGITDADLSDFFDDGEEFDEELDDEDEVLNNNPPHEITVATNEVAIVTQPERNDEQLNNLQPTVGAALNQQPLVPSQQQTVSGGSIHERRNSGGSSGPLSTLASVSASQSRARTRQNVISSAIETATSSNNNAFAAFLQHRQMSEEFELRQRRVEREEARAHREEELHEMRRKEIKQEEQRNMLFQLAITGMMAYFGVNKLRKDNEDEDDGKPHGV
jgi:hypothetical protein